MGCTSSKSVEQAKQPVRPHSPSKATRQPSFDQVLSYVLEEPEEDGEQKCLFMNIVLIGHDAVDIAETVCEAIEDSRSTCGSCHTPCASSRLSANFSNQPSQDQLGQLNESVPEEFVDEVKWTGKLKSQCDPSLSRATTRSSLRTSSKKTFTCFIYLGDKMVRVQLWPVADPREALLMFAPPVQSNVAYIALLPAWTFYPDLAESIRGVLSNLCTRNAHWSIRPPLVAAIPMCTAGREYTVEPKVLEANAQRWCYAVDVEDMTQGKTASTSQMQEFANILVMQVTRMAFASLRP
mmetsp:Transcript_34866/g.81481  ORF Transcript_34866/g.81481 Transcript_34866/m.81481 type:complete len:294 (+) Transcript_34866:70-951(+)